MENEKDLKYSWGLFSSNPSFFLRCVCLVCLLYIEPKKSQSLQTQTKPEKRLKYF